MSVDLYDEQRDLAHVIRQLRRDLDELKSRQRVAWDSLVTYKKFSSAQYDIARTLAQGAVQDYDVTFTFEHATDGAILDLNAFYRIDNPDVMGHPQARRSATNPQIAVRWTKTEAAATYARWRLIVINTSAVPASYTAYVKLYFDGTDTGSFSVQAI